MLCPPYRAFLIDPSSFKIIKYGPGPHQFDWLPGHGGPGSRLRLLDDGTTQRPTFYVQAACYASRGMLCDQPGINVIFKHIKSSNQ